MSHGPGGREGRAGGGGGFDSRHRAKSKGLRGVNLYLARARARASVLQDAYPALRGGR